MAPLRPIQIGNITIADPVILAPMTGVTDLPFRKLVRRFGSGLNVTEMIASQAAIRETRQSIQKAAWDPVEEPVSMQLVGCTPYEMGEAARLNEDRGAAIIDINMGCPVRKVTNGDAGSALMRDLKLASALIEACVKAVKVPVTVKMRMGWCHDSLNAPNLRISPRISGQSSSPSTAARATRCIAARPTGPLSVASRKRYRSR
jgi:tRNA-dihydrouridine synthase B